MGRVRRLAVLILVLALETGVPALAQIDPNADATTTDTASTDSTATTSDATNTGTALPTDTATVTDAPPATDTGGAVGVGGADSLPDRTTSRTSLALSIEAWVLPLAASIVGLVLFLVMHAILLSGDLRNWPSSSGSWFKLRLGPLLLALVPVAFAYWWFADGLSEETLRGVDSVARSVSAGGVLVLIGLACIPKARRQGTNARDLGGVSA